MASISNQLGEIRVLLEDQFKIVRNLEKKVDHSTIDVSRLLPRSYLPPIRKPVQGRDYVRVFNVATYLRNKIHQLNEQANGPKYLQFEPDVPDDVINGDAMHCLEDIPDLYGHCTWKEACEKEKRNCEMIIREAAGLQELNVFAQGAYYWPLRELSKQKMKSKLRTGKKKLTRRHEVLIDDDELRARQPDVPRSAVGDPARMTNAVCLIENERLERVFVAQQESEIRARETSFDMEPSVSFARRPHAPWSQAEYESEHVSPLRHRPVGCNQLSAQQSTEPKDASNVHDVPLTRQIPSIQNRCVEEYAASETPLPEIFTRAHEYASFERQSSDPTPLIRTQEGTSIQSTVSGGNRTVSESLIPMQRSIPGQNNYVPRTMGVSPTSALLRHLNGRTTTNILQNYDSTRQSEVRNVNHTAPNKKKSISQICPRGSGRLGKRPRHFAPSRSMVDVRREQFGACQMTQPKPK